MYENYKCNSKEELNRREGEIIRKIGDMNQIIAGRKREEYLNENKDKFIEYRKTYYNDHKMKKENMKKI